MNITPVFSNTGEKKIKKKKKEIRVREHVCVAT